MSSSLSRTLADPGVSVGDVVQMGPDGAPGSRYCFFTGADRNTWAVQEFKRSRLSRRHCSCGRQVSYSVFSSSRYSHPAPIACDRCPTVPQGILMLWRGPHLRVMAQG